MVKIDALKEKMASCGYNVSSLAKASGVDKSVISRIFNEQDYNCSIETAKKLSRTLKLSGKESSYIFLN